MKLDSARDGAFCDIVVKREEYASNVVGSHSPSDGVEEPRDYVSVIIDQKRRD